MDMTYSSKYPSPKREIALVCTPPTQDNWERWVIGGGEDKLILATKILKIHQEPTTLD